MSVEDRVREQVCLEVARPAVHHHVRNRGRHDAALVRVGTPAASAAAAGSNPRRNSDSETNCAARSPYSSRQRMTLGSKTFQRASAGW